VVRVHPELLERQHLPPEALGKGVWKRRFEQINHFEQYLVENGIVILKFFLNVSREEQKKRFLKRIDRAEKNWKFSAADAAERLYWDDYMDAYEDCLNHTSTKRAPWYVIPADYKPFMWLSVAAIIHEKIRDLRVDYPKIGKDQREELLKAKTLLEQES
jgi:polyphosphate kinase 2 (PPK2 family)